MKALFLALFIFGIGASALACSNWIQSDSCVYGEMKNGTGWKAQSCDPEKICRKIGHHPLPGASCEEDYVCLPTGLTPDDLAASGAICAPWEEMSKTDNRQACGDSRLKLWSREKECLIIGGNIATKACSENRPDEN